MNALFKGMASRSNRDHDMVSAVGLNASSPSDSLPRAMRGAVTGMVDALSIAGIHEHHQHMELPHAWV
jgi:hypothetical protein